MDPNEALKRLRHWAGDVLDMNQDGASVPEIEAAEQFRALDEWLAGGGFLPDDWKPLDPNRPADHEQTVKEAVERYLAGRPEAPARPGWSQSAAEAMERYLEAKEGRPKTMREKLDEFKEE